MVLLREGAMVENAKPKTLWAPTWARESLMTVLGVAEPARMTATRRRSPPTLKPDRPSAVLFLAVRASCLMLAASRGRALIALALFVAVAACKAGGLGEKAAANLRTGVGMRSRAALLSKARALRPLALE